MVAAVLGVAAVGVLAGAPLRAQNRTPARPDFSGTWVYDEARNTLTGRGGGPTSAKMLGDRVTIVQTDTEIAMTIENGPSRVTARYKLDGSDSVNVSPAAGGQADITVTSHATWDGAALIIDSTSNSIVNGQPVPLHSKRVLTIDADGLLTMDRTGTPPSLVIPTKSVYRKS